VREDFGTRALRRAERREGAPLDDTGLIFAVERGRCKERKTAALLKQWRGARWVNERDETQGAGIRMEEGQGILGGRETRRIARSWWESTEGEREG